MSLREVEERGLEAGERAPATEGQAGLREEEAGERAAACTDLTGAVWLASCAHVDSFSDLPEELAADFGRVAARVARAILSLGDVARVHLYRWGDGGAHFHVWFLPRPLGMVEAAGMMLPLWEDVLPNVPDEELAAAAERVAAKM